MIFLGYILIFIYAFILIFVIGNNLAKKYEVEISRKVIHILLFGIWVLIDYFMKNSIHQVIIPIVFLCINLLSYRFKFFKAIERETNNHLGTIFFALVITMILGIAYVYPSTYPYTGIATICLTFGDGFAGLLGYQYGKKKIWHNKSMIGFLSCFIFSLLGGIFYKIIYYSQIEWNDLFVICFVAAIVELVDYGLDNFTVPLSVFFLCHLLSFDSANAINKSLYIAIIVFGIVFLSKSIDYYGSLASMFVVFCFSYFGFKEGIIFLLLCYGLIFIISFLKKKFKKEEILECNAEGKYGKKFIQILANGCIGTLFIILYGFFKEYNYLLISFIAIAGCLIDSISSDIGTLSTKPPYDLFKRKYVERGLSGGISLLGTWAALLFTAAVTSIIIVLTKYSWNFYSVIFIIIFSQTLIDSCLGSLIQVKKKCTKCQVITEKSVHCNKKTEYYSGIPFVDNNVVNIISSVLTGILAWLCFIK